nr:MAG TPA: Ubiquitin-like protein [Crassvirales sp.]
MKTDFKPKLFIDPIVESKIRYLANKYPSNEWSGILFVEYNGNFDNESLSITARDLYVMDIGSSGFTTFDSRNAEYFSYAVKNNLDETCDFGLIHSHHNMNAFFSGTDSAELNATGKTRDVYVSLIVNNGGAYVAKITRRVQKKANVEWQVSYSDLSGNRIVTKSEEVNNIELEIYDCEIVNGAYNSVVEVLEEQIKKASKSGTRELQLTKAYPQSGITFQTKTTPTVNRTTPKSTYVPKPSTFKVSEVLPFEEESDDIFRYMDDSSTKEIDSIDDDAMVILDEIATNVILDVIDSEYDDLDEAALNLPPYMKFSDKLNVTKMTDKLDKSIDTFFDEEYCHLYGVDKEDVLAIIGEVAESFIKVPSTNFAIFRLIKFITDDKLNGRSSTGVKK